jgi:hypothetical protein
VLGPAPPLYASTCTSTLGLSSARLAAVSVGPLKLTLLVRNNPHGPARYHVPLPQSIRPAGNWPFNGVFGFASASNVTVCWAAGGAVALGVAVAAVALGVAVGATGVGDGVAVTRVVGVGVAVWTMLVGWGVGAASSVVSVKKVSAGMVMSKVPLATDTSGRRARNSAEFVS